MPKIDLKTWIAKYYEAGRQGLTFPQFAKSIGSTMGNAYSRRRYLEKIKGIKLPPLKRAPTGFHAHKKDKAEPSAPKPTRSSAPKPSISAEDFIRLWQTAESFEQAIEKSGLSHEVIRGKAAKLRKIGVPLKKFDSRGTKLDLPALIALAESLAPKAPAQ